MKNIIILGAGRTGSSFLAGLIARNEFYINRDKIVSRMGYPDGDYENPELVELNRSILLESGYGYSRINWRRPVDIDSIKNMPMDNEAYRVLIDKCNRHSPWLWKDPRLCYTIFLWVKGLKLDEINFLHITRDHQDIFKSYTKFEIDYSKKEAYRIYDEQNAAISQFCKEYNIQPLKIHYPEFRQKEEIINKLNHFLGTKINASDYDNIYRSNIRKKETSLQFKARYYWGLMKLKVNRILNAKGTRK
jgi:hypothetical protein